MPNEPITFRVEEAVADLLAFLISKFKEGARLEYGSSYGYDVELNSVYGYSVAAGRLKGVDARDARVKEAAFPSLMEAAWVLCQRGVLRPGVNNSNRQVTETGSGGTGFSLTTAGRRFLGECDLSDFQYSGPESLSRLITNASATLGRGFNQRAQQAISCRAANAHLACCAMCGAAAECVLLTLAVHTGKSESDATKELRTPTGRKSLASYLFSKLDPTGKRLVSSAFELLNYWRDDASHAGESAIGVEDADVAVAELLRLAKYAADLM